MARGKFRFALNITAFDTVMTTCAMTCARHHLSRRTAENLIDNARSRLLKDRKKRENKKNQRYIIYFSALGASEVVG